MRILSENNIQTNKINKFMYKERKLGNTSGTTLTDSPRAERKYRLLAFIQHNSYHGDRMWQAVFLLIIEMRVALTEA